MLSTLLQARDKGLPLPAGVIAIAPTVQYDQIFTSYRDNQSTDCIVGNLSDEVCDAYLQTKDIKVLKNPYAAPYYVDYSNCVPIYLLASKSEVLRDDSIYFYEKLTKGNHPCKLYLRDKMMHTYIIIPTIPEAKKDLKLLKEWIDNLMNGGGINKNEIIYIK